MNFAKLRNLGACQVTEVLNGMNILAIAEWCSGQPTANGILVERPGSECFGFLGQRLVYDADNDEYFATDDSVARVLWVLP